MDGYVPSQEAGAAWLPPDHVQYCFSRYRSYRPEDNSYQPYSGGPRRQCE
ncbi:BA14K family protein [Mesorhizobium sp.]